MIGVIRTFVIVKEIGMCINNVFNYAYQIYF